MFDSKQSGGTPAEYVARQAETVGEMFLKRVERDGDAPAFYFKQDDAWQPVGWSEFLTHAGAVATYLLGLGLQIQDGRPRCPESRALVAGRQVA